MKTKKLILTLALVVMLLLGTALAASAGNSVRLTGGMNQSFFGFGWEWLVANVSLDPGTQEADGIVHYKVYLDDGNPKVWEAWTGAPICGALGDFDGAPTMALVLQIVDQKNFDPTWVGKYMKVTLTDGGQNASKDLLGIVDWDFVNNQPVDYQPSCDYEAPDTVIYYPGDNGNITIHD